MEALTEHEKTDESPFQKRLRQILERSRANRRLVGPVECSGGHMFIAVGRAIARRLKEGKKVQEDVTNAPPTSPAQEDVTNTPTPPDSGKLELIQAIIKAYGDGVLQYTAALSMISRVVEEET